MQYEWPGNRRIESEVPEEGQRICVYSTVIENEFTVEDDDDDTKVQGTVFLGHALPTAGKDKKTVQNGKGRDKDHPQRIEDHDGCADNEENPKVAPRMACSRRRGSH